MAIVEDSSSKGAQSMAKMITGFFAVTTVGLDLAKKYSRCVEPMQPDKSFLRGGRKDVIGFFAGLPRCLIGMEACSSSHHWRVT
jgi:transposase